MANFLGIENFGEGLMFALSPTVFGMKKQQDKADAIAEQQVKMRQAESAERANQARIVRREQIRQSRIKRAEIENTAATSGQTGSSAAIASGDSLQARLGTNFGTIQESLQFSSVKSNIEQNIFDIARPTDYEVLHNFGSGKAQTFASAYVGKG